MADERDEKGRLSDAVPKYWPNKYGSAQVAENKLNVPLPRDEASNKQILRQTIRVNLLLAPKLRNTMLTHHVLIHQDGAVLRSIISSCKTQ